MSLSFIGFFPAARPQVDISVVVDDADAHTPPGDRIGAAGGRPRPSRTSASKLIPYLDIRTGVQNVADQSLALEGGRR